ncbi:MAG: VCBS repeat-containing protein [Polyangiales bacterium]
MSDEALDASRKDTATDAADERLPDIAEEGLPDAAAAVDARAEVAVEDDDVPCGEILVSPETSFDAGPGATPCTPGRALRCRCDTGGAGIQACDWYGRMGPCMCVDRPVIAQTDPDAGIVVYPDASTELPPRLIAPLSGRRVMSQRPTLRWALPAGVRRAQVKLCEDRVCARPIARVEVTGSSWRPPTPLRPGVVFWRVIGLRDDGASVWTSATWEFGVRHRDTPTDTIGGPLKDFNGDGYDDAVLGEILHGVRFIRGGPGGAHRQPSPILYNPGTTFGLGAAVGEFNGDGLADLVILDDDPGRIPLEMLEDRYVRIFHGNAGCPIVEAGTIRSPLFGVNSIGSGIAAGDFNGDGFGDLVTSGYYSLTLYLGSDRGLSRVPASHITVDGLSQVPNLSNSYMVGDVDGDGYGDFVLGNYGASDGDGEVLVFYGNPMGHLEARVQRISSPDGQLFGLGVIGGDFSGDGLADLIVTTQASWVYYYHGSSRGLRFAQRIVPENGRGSAVGAPGDFNGDGLVDLVLANSGYIYRSHGTMDFTEQPDILIPASWIAPGWRLHATALASPGDVDSDGDDDLLCFSDYGSPLMSWDAVYLFRGGRVESEPPANTWLIRDVSYIR